MASESPSDDDVFMTDEDDEEDDEDDEEETTGHGRIFIPLMGALMHKIRAIISTFLSQALKYLPCQLEKDCIPLTSYTCTTLAPDDAQDSKSQLDLHSSHSVPMQANRAFTSMEFSARWHEDLLL